jgi:TetR/AcrR family transcriptional regulator, repressor for uid operon
VSAGEPAPERRSRVGSKSVATRAALVDLAAELFAERGYMQTSIRDIARRGGLTTGAIYGHFRNKADLLVEAINDRTAEELEAHAMVGPEPNYVETLTRLAHEFPRRAQLRALIVQGAAAAQIDDLTRERLCEEQMTHISAWIDGYQMVRDQQGIDPSLDIEAAVLGSWALELGLGVLEGIGVPTPRVTAWADIHNRLARSWQLPPADVPGAAPRSQSRRRSPQQRRFGRRP